MIVQDPAAVVAPKDVVKLNQLKTNPFARLNLAEKYPLVVESQFKSIKVLLSLQEDLPSFCKRQRGDIIELCYLTIDDNCQTFCCIHRFCQVLKFWMNSY